MNGFYFAVLMGIIAFAAWGLDQAMDERAALPSADRGDLDFTDFAYPGDLHFVDDGELLFDSSETTTMLGTNDGGVLILEPCVVGEIQEFSWHTGWLDMSRPGHWNRFRAETLECGAQPEPDPALGGQNPASHTGSGR